MKKVKGTWKSSLLLAVVFSFMVCFPVMASELSNDNSLSSIEIYNGTLEPEFEYSIWEYNVTVEPGTEEVFLDYTTSHPNASASCVGTVLVDGETTIKINTESESGVPMTYTLYVTESGAASDSESESESEVETTEQNETVTQTQTESQIATEPDTENNAIELLELQVDDLKSKNDLLMKIIYGLIAAIVILLIIIINLIMKNHDLKKDLKDAEDQIAYQTNEFARKEKSLSSGNYYAPVRQNEAPQPMDRPQALEETFGASPESQQQEILSKSRTNEKKDDEKEDVDVKMVEL